jgi:hypothetical protein
MRSFEITEEEYFRGERGHMLGAHPLRVKFDHLMAHYLVRNIDWRPATGTSPASAVVSYDTPAYAE